MRKTKIFLSLAVFFGLSLAAARADQVAATGDQFTILPPGPREAALGGTYSALSDEAFGVFGNPAATGVLLGGNISLSQLFWFANTNVETGAYTQNIEGFGTLGLGLMVYWVPAFDNTGGAQASFSSTSYEGVVSYSTPLNDWGWKGFTLGASARYIANNFNGLIQTNDWALDLGAYYQTPWKPLKLGASLYNIALSTPSVDAIPLFYSMGFTLGQDFWLISAEMMEINGQNAQYQAGGELWFEKFLAVRAGFRSQSTAASYFGPSAGVGLKLGEAVGFDYAIASYGDLGLVNWISLDLSWDRTKAQPTPIPTSVPKPSPTPTLEPTPVNRPAPEPKKEAAPALKNTFVLRGSVTSDNIVLLSWDPPGLYSGYNAYVSLVQGAGFKKMNDQPITVTNWSDRVGLHGITFYYQVKALDANGTEVLTSEVHEVTVP